MQDVCNVWFASMLTACWDKHRKDTQASHVRCFSLGFPFELGKFHKPQICKSTSRASRKKPRRIAQYRAKLGCNSVWWVDRCDCGFDVDWSVSDAVEALTGVLAVVIFLQLWFLWRLTCLVFEERCFVMFCVSTHKFLHAGPFVFVVSPLCWNSCLFQ